MKHLCSTIILLLCTRFIAFSGNTFEGIYQVEYKNEKGEISKLSVSVKDSLVLLKSIAGGNAKYVSYILNLNSNQLIAVSKPAKKVAIIYPLNKLLTLYEKNELKEGYKINSEIPFKSTDKTKEEYGIKMTKYTGESNIYKSSLWLAETGFDFNQLIPLLRLIGCWNEAQVETGTIMEAEVNGKVSKKTSTLVVTFKKESLTEGTFEVPKNYLQKDFVKLMEEEKDNKDLKMIIQTFAGF